ncbi:MAG: NADH:flavin oxidoreductase [Candidatus Tectomicrobia bacterium]|uniref:NADH:flavin oxidoreductase n=1 Tax=Tectimicrobiota bacterium TaxID=2528274 RepID=A0A932CP61_UNCTE|nr:NADH:flavin oxidoreductase [Candidatus Tectomicrobia bacterium]
MRLFSPIRIGSLELKNRLAFAPCGTNYASEEGFPTERLLSHYRRIARGGSGLVIVEATSVNHQRRRREKHCLGIYEDRFIPPLRTLVSQIHHEGGRAAIQLVDSLLAVGKRPADLSLEEIDALIDDFVSSSLRAREAGFDAIEYHMAHLYTLADFLSRKGNKRQDAFGGNAEGRLRIAQEVLRRSRQALGSGIPFLCRINGDEFTVGGNTLQDARQIARRLVEFGAEAIHVSAGGRIDDILGSYREALLKEKEGSAPPGQGAFELLSQCYSLSRTLPSAEMPDGVNVYLAEGIKKAVPVPVIAVGKINHPDLAEEIVREERADLVALCRPLLADPAWPNKVREGRADQIVRCRCCNRCLAEVHFRGQPLLCSAWDGRETPIEIA